MRARDVLWLGYKGLRERKLRAAITILSVVIGVASIIALVSQTTGIQTSIVGALQSLGPTSIIITGGRTQLTQADVANIGTLPYVQTVIPMLSSQFTLTESGQPTTLSVIGVDSQGLQSLLGSINLADGNLYPASTVPLAVVGYNIAFPPGSQNVYIGQPLILTQQLGQSSRSVTIQVVGLLDKYGSSSFISPDSTIFIPMNAMMNILNRKTYTLLLIKAIDVDHVTNVQQLLTNIYGNSVQILTIQSITSSVSQITGLLGVLLGAIAAISLSVAGLGIMNIMLVSVFERIHEIGIMKAIGFKDRNILTLFLSESAIVGILGGILGIIAGAGVSAIIPILLSALLSSSNIGQNTGTTSGRTTSAGGGFGGFGGFGSTTTLSYTPVITPDIIFISLLIAISVSIIAGLYPAWRASRMEPIKALRYE